MVVCGSLAFGGIAMGSQRKAASTLSLVKDFHKWKKANPEPVRMLSKFDLLCRTVMPGEIAKEQKVNPHIQRYITVYVNPIGEKAMMKGGSFPIGSVVVKEKFEKDLKTPVLSTIMIKRERGYNPACGDWQFAVLDAFTSKLEGDGKIDSCMNCHKTQPKQDFVYRTYVGKKGRVGGK